MPNFRMPPGLPQEIARPLYAVAAEIQSLRPWEYMSDAHVIGLRDEEQNDLRLASVLGTLGQVFAVVVHRGPQSLNWIYRIITGREYDDILPSHTPPECLRIEWVLKRALQKPDLASLAAAGIRPGGKGVRWPKLEKWEPGWAPWFLTGNEAMELTRHLQKVLRFAELFRSFPGLYDKHPGGEIPIITAGETLTPDGLQWLPFVPPPMPIPEPVRLSESEESRLKTFGLAQNLTCELDVRLVPEACFQNPEEDRPVMGKAGMLCDHASGFIFATHMDAGNAPTSKPAHKMLVDGIRNIGSRPGTILVATDEMRLVAGAACESLGITLRQVPELPMTDYAMESMVNELFRRRRP